MSGKVLELVSGQKLYGKPQMMELLGVCNTTYYKILKTGVLPYSRKYPGGPIVHTEDQYREYLRWLNDNRIVQSQRLPRRRA